MSLANCLLKFGAKPGEPLFIPKVDRRSLVEAADRLKKLGMSQEQAEAKAVRERLDALRAEEKRILGEVDPKVKAFADSLPKVEDGTYKGSRGKKLPELKKVIDELVQMAEEGRPAKGWYKETVDQLMKSFEGNKAAVERFIQVIAITSANTEVKANFTIAEKALLQFAFGQEIDVQSAQTNGKLNDLLYFGIPWDGRKTNTFYTNFMEELYGKASVDTTQDVHMGRRILGVDQLSDAEYTFADAVTKFVGEYVGMKPIEAQAAIWVAQKARSLYDNYIEKGFHRGSSDAAKRRLAMAEASVHYGKVPEQRGWFFPPQGLDLSTSENMRAKGFNVTAEVKPTTKLDIGKRLAELSNKAMRDYQIAALSHTFGEKGANAFFEALGLNRSQYRVVQGVGGYDGTITPNVIYTLNGTRDQADALARAWMYIFKQDAVPFFRADPTLKEDPGSAIGALMSFKAPLSITQERQVYDALRANVHTGIGYTKTNPSEIVVINFRGDDNQPLMMSDEDFKARLDSLIDEGKIGLEVDTYGQFGAETGYPYHDWEQDPAGESLVASAAGQSPAFQERVRGWADRFADFAKGQSQESRVRSERRSVGVGMNRAELQAHVNSITEIWKGGPPIRVMARAEAPFKTSEDAQGAFHGGSVYLFHDNLPNKYIAEFTMLHEVFGHYGIRGVMGNRMTPVMNSIYRSNPWIKKAADVWAADPVNQAKRGDMTDAEWTALATEEALSDVAASESLRSRLPELNGWNKIVAAFRNFLRSLGFTLEMSDTDIQSLLASARSFVEKGDSEFNGKLAPANSNKAPVFYSELATKLNAIPQKSATADQWKGLIKNMTGVKAEEIEWSGVMEWLDTQTGKVAKEAVAKFIEANGVQVTEKMLGETDRLLTNRLPDGWELRELEPNEDVRYEVVDSDGMQRGLGDSLEDAMADANTSIDYSNQVAGTKFQSYQLPGGENYRELLLKLPPMGATVYTKDNVIPVENLDPTFNSMFWYFNVPGNTFQIAKSKYPTQQEALDYIIREKQPRPPIEKNFSGSHWDDEVNVVAHVRFNERTDADGNRVLFLEEIQSDWAQRGRKGGFADGDTQKKMEALDTEIEGMRKEYRDLTRQAIALSEEFHQMRDDAADLDKQGKTDEADRLFAAAIVKQDEYKKIDQIADELRDKMNEKIAQRQRLESAMRNNYPAAPFVTKTEAWAALALKRMLRYAAENGFDKVAWTNGAKQADRYDLSKKVSAVHYVKSPTTSGTIGLLVYANDGQTVIEKSYKPEELPDVIGKDIADKIINDEGKPSEVETHNGDVMRTKVLSGLDLKVGGEGMIAFYDKIIPNIVNGLLKKLGGGRVETVAINLAPDEAALASAERSGDSAAIANALGGTAQQMGFTITPALRDSVMRGLPLFSRGKDGGFGEFMSGLTNSVRSRVEAWKAQGAYKHPINTAMIDMSGSFLTITGYGAKDTAGELSAIKRPEGSDPVIPAYEVLYDGDTDPLTIPTDVIDRYKAIENSEAGRRTAKAEYDSAFSFGWDEAGDYMAQRDAQQAMFEAEGLYKHNVGDVIMGPGGVAMTVRERSVFKDDINDDAAPWRPSYSVSFRVADSSVKQGYQNSGSTVFASEANSYPVISKGQLLESRASYADLWSHINDEQKQAFENVFGKPLTFRDRARKLFANAGLKLQQGVFDQFAPIMRDIGFKEYILARMSKASDGTLEATLKYGIPTLRGDIFDIDTSRKGFIERLQKLAGEQDLWAAWVAANRAEQLKAEGKENLFSDDDIIKLKNLNHGTMKDGRSRAAVYGQALADLREFNKAILDIAEARGIIDGESRSVWDKGIYIPFYRNLEDGSTGPSVKSGLVNQYAFKKLKGGKDKLNTDLLANILQNWSHLLSASAKNAAAKATLDKAEELGVAYQVPSGTKKAVKYLENGNEKNFLVEDEFILDAVSSMDAAGLPDWAKPLGKFKNILTLGVTASPSFKIRNLIRDSIAAMAMGDLSYNPAKNVAQGLKASKEGNPTFIAMLANGGLIRFGAMLDGNRADHTRRLIEAGVNGDTILNTHEKVTAFLQKTWDTYNEYGDRTENANRAALYQQQIARGVDPLVAAFGSRDLMDFSMSGSFKAVRFLTQVVPFMNARLQGLYKLGRAAKEDPRRMGYVIGAVALASLTLMLAYRDDDDWKKREDWDRDNFWWFKVGGVAYRIPKPFEVGSMGTIAERTLELMIDDEMTGKRFGQRMADMMSNTFAMSPVPQLFKPMLDIYANKDGFTGRAIEGMGMQKLRPQDRYNAQTSEAARFLGSLGLPDVGQALQGKYSALSPIQIDHLIRGYFGWLGVAGVTTLDYGVRPLLNRPDKPEMSLRQTFFIGGFAETLPSNSSRYVTQLYEQSKEIEQAYASYRDALSRGDIIKANEVLDKERGKISQYKSVAAVKRAEATIERMTKIVEESTTMTPAQKRARLDELAAQKDRIARMLKT